MKLPSIRATAIAAFLVLVAVCAYGWVLATHAAPNCVRDTTSEVMAQNIRVPRLDGSVVTGAQIAVSSKVEWPFVVSVAYFVPSGLHANYYENRYFVLPWRTIKAPQEPVYFL